MIPAVAKRGTSFKGAGLYYLHDKRQAGEETRFTSERVAWTQTRNLATNDPDFSLRIMAATALDQDRLKQAAGVKKTGQKSKGAVYAYSLAWHPDETGKFDEKAMQEAVDQSIKALGAQKHQALIVAHQDEPQPHVHIILNMVNPETGKNLPLSNDYRKLDNWANEYRKKRGEEHIYTPSRAKKYEAIADKKRGNVVPFICGEKNIPRRINDEFNELKPTTDRHERRELLQTQRTADMKLSQTGRQMASRHANQWEVLSQDFKDKKAVISARYFKDKQAGIAEIKQANKPLYSELVRRQWNEKRQFERFEKTIGGRIRNAFATMASIRSDEDRVSILAAFNYAYRLAAMEKNHARQLREFRAAESKTIKQSTVRLNERRVQKVGQARATFGADRHALIQRQGGENNDLQEAWKTRNQRKKQAFAGLKAKSLLAVNNEIVTPTHDKKRPSFVERENDRIIARQNKKNKVEQKLRTDGKLSKDEEKLLDQSEIVAAKGQFKRRAEEKKKERGKGRTRSRKRNRDED